MATRQQLLMTQALIPLPKVHSKLPTYAFVGNFCDIKGADNFLKLVENLQCRFRVIGNVFPNYINKLHSFNIEVTGKYTIQELPTLLQDVDIVFIPTQANESFCLVLSEIQQLKIPHLVSNRGALTERTDKRLLCDFNNIDEVIHKIYNIPKDIIYPEIKSIQENAREYGNIYRS